MQSVRSIFQATVKDMQSTTSAENKQIARWSEPGNPYSTAFHLQYIHTYMLMNGSNVAVCPFVVQESYLRNTYINAYIKLYFNLYFASLFSSAFCAII